MIRHIIFDLGGVLVNWRPQHIVDGFYSEPTLCDALLQQVFRHPDWLEMDRGTLKEDAAVQRFAGRMERPVQEMATLLDHVKASMTPIVETVALAERLHARGYSLYALSNMSEPAYGYLKARHAFFTLFRDVVISGIVGVIKPDEKIFAHAAERFGLTYGEAVFIDDHLPNIEAARRLRLTALPFADARQCARDLAPLLDLEIASLSR